MSATESPDAMVIDVRREPLVAVVILYSVVLAYLVASHAGHVWGLDAWAARLPFLARRKGLRAPVA